MTGYDDSIDRLQAFIVTLRTTIQGVTEKETELETLGGTLKDLDATADQALQHAIDTLDEQERELEASQAETAKALHALAEAGHQLAQRAAAVDAEIESDLNQA